ncbi:Uncharacterised protein [Sphingobacterium multivorum]|uniref:Uncharacterized protein n=1 Tax=Sphingobacterium multivorum TaxID=28454 RepID=A0A2X2KU01_SPHMU|nr:hypothetical protein [Sphingobacterium multivorum]SPZ85559.1 Uncharacterised protein [Sphingobacterium multivorum]
MEEQDHGWLLHFKNGKSFYADLVVAADGANSKIRPYLTDIKPIYSGITIVEGMSTRLKKTHRNFGKSQKAEKSLRLETDNPLS